MSNTRSQVQRWIAESKCSNKKSKDWRLLLALWKVRLSNKTTLLVNMLKRTRKSPSNVTNSLLIFKDWLNSWILEIENVTNSRQDVKCTKRSLNNTRTWTTKIILKYKDWLPFRTSKPLKYKDSLTSWTLEIANMKNLDQDVINSRTTGEIQSLSWLLWPINIMNFRLNTMSRKSN